MVGVTVGEYHLCYFCLVDAGGLEIAPQLSRRRHEAVTRAHVDEDQVVVCADQRDVGRCIVLLAGLAGGLENGLALGRRRAGRKKARRQHEVTVAHDGNVKRAVPERVGCGGESGQGARGKACSGCSKKRAAIECWHLRTKTMTEADCLLRQCCTARHMCEAGSDALCADYFSRFISR